MARGPLPLSGRRLLLLVGTSAAFGLLVLAHNYNIVASRGGVFTWREGAITFSRGMEWAVLAPLVIGLVRRFPPHEGRWLPFVGVHLVFVVALHSLTEVPHTALSFALDTARTQEVNPAEFYWGTWRSALMLHLIIYAAVAGAAYGYDRRAEALRYQEAAREREVRAARLESELAQAQLHALRMQLNPHFLFNTLSAASALVTRDPHRARQVIVYLGELLRLSLDTTEEEVPLRDELVFLDHYLRIEEARMGDRLRVRVHADDDALDALVPPLILQPLVENAVKHGVAPVRGGGAVEVAAARERGDVVLRVSDTGPGLPDAAEPCRGIGLRNTRRRLERLYGADAALSLDTTPGAGLTATVRLPFRSTHDALSPAHD